MAPRPALVDGQHVAWIDGTIVTDVVGESFRARSFYDLFGYGEIKTGAAAVLMPELANPFDPNALSVRVRGVVVGYLPRTEVRWRHAIVRVMDRYRVPVACAAHITGTGSQACVRLLLPDVDGLVPLVLSTPHDLRAGHVWLVGESNTRLTSSDEQRYELIDIDDEDDTTATLGEDLAVHMLGRHVGDLTSNAVAWRTTIVTLGRQYRLPVRCQARIDSAKQEVFLSLPRLRISS